MFDVATISYVSDTRGLRDASREMEGVNRNAERVSSSARALGRVFAGLFAGFSLASVANQFSRLESQVSEVITLFTRNDLGDLGFTGTSRIIQRELELISALSGQTAETLSSGLFDIVSAGTTDQAQALQVLETATDLAIAGATDVSTAVSGVTGILNAYSLSADEALSVSQGLFVAQRFGVTTVEELAGSIGRVAPLASQLGISMDELLAAQAGITSVTQNQSEAVSGLRAALSSIIRPSQDAQDAAKDLQIDFSAAGLQAQGFTEFLNGVIDATGGNVQSLSTLFGSIEGVNTVLALAGGGADAYRGALEALSDEVTRNQLFSDALAGRTETLNFRMGQLGQTVSAVSTALGTGFVDSFLGGFLDEITTSEEGLRQLLSQAEAVGSAIGTAFRIAAEAIRFAGEPLIALTAGFAAYRIALVASAATTAVFTGGLSALTASLAATRTAMISLLLANPFAILAAAVTALGVILFRNSETFREYVSNIIEGARIGANALVAAFSGAFAGIQAIFGNLPAFLGDITITAANEAIEAISDLVERATRILSVLPGASGRSARAANTVLGAADFSIPNPFEGTVGDVARAARDAFNEASNDDFAGDLIGTAVRSVESLKQVITGGGSGGDGVADVFESASTVATTAISGLTDEQERLIEETERFIERGASYVASVQDRANALSDNARVLELQREGTVEAQLAIVDLRLARELENIEIERGNRLKELSVRLDSATADQAVRLRSQIEQLETSYDNLAEATVRQSNQAIIDIERQSDTLQNTLLNSIDGLFDGSLSFGDIFQNLLNDARGAFLEPFRDDLRGAVQSLFSETGSFDFSGFFRSFSSGLSGVFERFDLGGFFNRIGDGISSLFGSNSSGNLAALGEIGAAGSIGAGAGGVIGDLFGNQEAGSLIGAGAAIGLQFGGPIGAAVGAGLGAIGAAITGAFDSAPRLQGFFDAEEGRISVSDVETRSGAGREVADQIGQGINDVLERLGADVTDALDFTVLFKPEDDFLDVNFGNIVRDFAADDIEGALVFAIQTILGDSSLSTGISDELRNSISSGVIESLDDLEAIITEEFNRVQALFNPFLESLSAFGQEIASQPAAFASAAESIRDFLGELDFNDLSDLSPQAQLDLARSQFEQTFADAQSGDLNAIQNITAVADRFLGLSRDVNASSTAFQIDRASVVDALGQVEQTALTGEQRSIAQLAELESIATILENGITVSNIGDITAALTSFGSGSVGEDGTVFVSSSATQSAVGELLELLGTGSSAAGFAAPDTNVSPPTTGPLDRTPFFATNNFDFEEFVRLQRETAANTARIAASSQSTAANTSDNADGLEAVVTELQTQVAETAVVNPTETPAALVQSAKFI